MSRKVRLEMSYYDFFIVKRLTVNKGTWVFHIVCPTSQVDTYRAVHAPEKESSEKIYFRALMLAMEDFDGLLTSMPPWNAKAVGTVTEQDAMQFFILEE